MDKPRCKDCKHMEKLRHYKGFGVRRTCYCRHPNGYDSAVAAGVKRAPSFIAYTGTDGIVTIKTSPRWCPLRNKTGDGRH